MIKTTIYYKKVKLNDPILIVGLPGVGYVGGLVAEQLRSKLGAKKLATLYSPYFPYQIITLKNGGFRLVSNRFYYYKNKNKKGRDLVILMGDCQPLSPEGQYDVNERIVKFFKNLGGNTIYTIGGYNTGNRNAEKPRIFGVSSDEQVRTALSKFGIRFGEAAGISILGSAGMILAFSKKHNVQAACIMGETNMLEVDATAAKSVLRAMGEILDVPVDFKNLDRIQKDTEKAIREIEDISGSALEAQQGPAGQQVQFESQKKKEDLTYIR